MCSASREDESTPSPAPTRKICTSWRSPGSVRTVLLPDRYSQSRRATEYPPVGIHAPGARPKRVTLLLHQFDAPILGAAVFGVVGGYRGGRPVPLRAEARRGNAVFRREHR